MIPSVGRARPVNLRVMRLFHTLVRRMLRKTFLIGMALLAPHGLSRIASLDDHPGDQGCKIERVVRESGWELPSLQGMKVSAPRQFAPRGHTDPRATYVVFTPSEELPYKVDYFDVQPSGEMIVRTRDCKATSVYVFSYQGVQYAFGLDLILVHFDPKTGTGGTGGETALLFFDDDRDGLFESRESAASPIVRRLPRWAESKSSSPTAPN